MTSRINQDQFRFSVADALVDEENHDAERLRTDFQNHIKVFIRLGVFIEINGDVFRFTGKYNKYNTKYTLLPHPKHC